MGVSDGSHAAAIDQAVTDMQAAEQALAEAVTAVEQKLGTMGLPQDQNDALSAEVSRMREAVGRLGAAKGSLVDVTAELSDDPTGTAGTEAATVDQPAAPAEAGEGVVHEDGSVAPDGEQAPAVGTTEVVQ